MAEQELRISVDGVAVPVYVYVPEPQVASSDLFETNTAMIYSSYNVESRISTMSLGSSVGRAPAA